jgi:hypothetical protein
MPRGIIIEDTISREKAATKEFQENWRRHAEWLKKIDCDEPWVQHRMNYAIMRSKMTYLEDQAEKLEVERIREEENQKFLKNNPPKKEKVEKLYERFDKVKHNLIPMPGSQVCFNRDLLDPLDGILTGEEFDSIQYDAILELLFQEYQNIHEEEIEKIYGGWDDDDGEEE